MSYATVDNSIDTPSLKTFTLPATTIHITKEELEQLLIAVAKSKIQDSWEFAVMKSDKFGGYKLTFIKTDQKVS